MEILQVCAYGANYSGNFIKSLKLLELKMKNYGYKTIYVFVDKAKNKDWCKKL